MLRIDAINVFLSEYCDENNFEGFVWFTFMRVKLMPKITRGVNI